MLFKPFIAVLSVSLIILLVMSSCKHRSFYKADPQKKAEWLVKKLDSELSFTEQQKAEVEKIKTEVLQKLSETKSIKTESVNLILRELKKENIDTENLNNLFIKKEDRLKEMRPFIIEKIVEFHKILTTEQRLKLFEKIEELMDIYHK